MIVGIDEVGRGCWAGPLVAAAVVLGQNKLEGLTDSKKLSVKSRRVVYSQILENAIAIGVGWVEADFIDKNGLTAATQLAMRRALDKIGADYSQIIVDGNINYLSDNPRAVCLVKADASVPEVSAASIVAKVKRDEFMRKIAEKYPAYGFDKHVGYGTPEHLKQLRLHGICNIHRLSYKPIQEIVSLAI